MDEFRSWNFDQWMDGHGWPIFWTILTALILFFVVKRAILQFVRPAVARQMHGSPEEEIKLRATTLTGVFVGTTKAIIITLAVLAILPELGIDTRALLAGVSVTSLAISFGAQSLVRDGLNGIFILGENQYTIGDTVTLAGTTGVVEEVTLRRTVLRDVDGTVHTVPNGTIATASNHTRDYGKIRVMIAVAPASDLATVRAIADRVGREIADDPQFAEKIVEAPAYVGVANVDLKGAIAVHVVGVAVPGTQHAIRGALRARLLAALLEGGITVP